MKTASRSYLEGALAVASSTFVSAAAGFVSLVILTQILTKDELGGYAFAFSILSLALFMTVWGFERTIMLRVARYSPDADGMRGRRLALHAAAVSLGLSVLLIALLTLAAGGFVKFSGVAEVGVWIPLLSLALVPMSISTILQVWFRANHRVVRASLTYGAVDATRAILLVTVYVLGWGVTGVAMAVVASTCVPILILGWAGRKARNRPPLRLHLRNALPGLFFVAQKYSSYGLRLFDVILLGLLADGTAIAVYAVAARLAALCSVGTDALQPTFLPRVRRYVVVGDLASATREYHMARAAAFLLALAVAFVMIVAAPLLLAFLGGFEASFEPLMILIAGYLLSAGSGLHIPFLTMQGEILGVTLLRVGALGLLFLGSFLLVPGLGPIGVALALTGALIVMNLGALYYLWRRTGFSGITPASATVMGLGIASLSAGAFGLIGAPFVAASLASIAVLSLALDRYSRIVMNEALARMAMLLQRRNSSSE